MRRTWPIIAVSSVSEILAWYQALFGQPLAAPAHDHFGMIRDEDETVLLCLHAWGEHDHSSLFSPERGRPGNGLILFFRVPDYDEVLTRALSLVNVLEAETQINPGTGTREFAIRDPDGYSVMISSLT